MKKILDLFRRSPTKGEHDDSMPSPHAGSTPPAPSQQTGEPPRRSPSHAAAGDGSLRHPVAPGGTPHRDGRRDGGASRDAGRRHADQPQRTDSRRPERAPRSDESSRGHQGRPRDEHRQKGNHRHDGPHDHTRRDGNGGRNLAGSHENNNRHNGETLKHTQDHAGSSYTSRPGNRNGHAPSRRPHQDDAAAASGSGGRPPMRRQGPAGGGSGGPSPRGPAGRDDAMMRPRTTTPVPMTQVEPKELPKAFAELGLSEPLLRALAQVGYDKPTPIQASTIPFTLAGRDVLGCAQTGTGKTAAFALPILQRLHDRAPVGGGTPRALVLAPTRELALQIDESFRDYGRYLRLGHTVIFGGVGQRPQEEAIRRRPAVLTATPGRLLDLVEQGCVDLRSVEIFVLDEADRMLDMGFINDVKKVIARLPRERQNLLFSATMPPDIQELADRLLTDPAKVAVAPVASTVDSIEQWGCFVAKGDKLRLLGHLLDNNPSMERVIVFTRTKHGANRVAETLTSAGIRSEAIHGNKSQSARQRALDNFKRGVTRVLVASDLASRGIDVDKVTHVINYELPNIPETYVHRIGRTGRAEESGVAIAFCEHEELGYLRDIERLTKRKLKVMDDHPWHDADLSQGIGGRPPPPQGGRGSRSGRGGGSRGGPQRGGGGGGGGSRGGPQRGPSSQQRRR